MGKRGQQSGDGCAAAPAPKAPKSRAKAKAKATVSAGSAEGPNAHSAGLMGLPPSEHFDLSITSSSLEAMAVEDDEKVNELRATVRDSRKCLLCPAIMDKTPDPVFPSELIYWNRKPRLVSKPCDAMVKYMAEGTCDYYCDKTFHRVYQYKYKTIQDFVAALGTVHGLLQEFQASLLENNILNRMAI